MRQARSDIESQRPNGKIRARHRRLASLAAMGTPVDAIASQTGLSKSRIYHLLSESEFVNAEIARVQGELLESQRFLLVSLYRKGLEQLEEDLELGDPERRLRGVDRVVQLWTLANGGGGLGRRFGLV